MVRVWRDYLKPGERSQGGEWCFSVSRNGHVTLIKTGFYSEEEAKEEAAKHG